MKGHMDTKYGDIYIDKNVISQYAGGVAVESFGIVGMAKINIKQGLFSLLKKEELSQGVNIFIKEDNTIEIEFHIIAAYGVNIISVTENLIENVKYKVEEFCSMKISAIKVYVEGVRKVD